MILKLSEEAQKKIMEAFRGLREIGIDVSPVRIEIEVKDIWELGKPFPTHFIQKAMGRIEFEIPMTMLETDK